MQSGALLTTPNPPATDARATAIIKVSTGASIHLALSIKRRYRSAMRRAPHIKLYNRISATVVARSRSLSVVPIAALLLVSSVTLRLSSVIAKSCTDLAVFSVDSQTRGWRSLPPATTSEHWHGQSSTQYGELVTASPSTPRAGSFEVSAPKSLLRISVSLLTSYNLRALSVKSR